jgi:hypothetical protein
LEIGEQIRKAVDKHYADASYAEPHREHLGASIIGNACDRQIWYSFRWAKKVKHTGRIVRLFSRGHHEEPRFAEQLTSIGATIETLDPATDKQWRFEMYAGHFAGSNDGLISGLDKFGLSGRGILECKTHNDKSFKGLKDKGVLTSKPVHYAQMQIYMHYFKCDWALYVAVNKNDDELYFEIVTYAQPIAEHLIARAEAIICMPRPPRRISENPAWWACKHCDFYDICHHSYSLAINCRTCIQSFPSRDGGWGCNRFGTIPPDFAHHGCAEWDPVK